MKMEGYGAGGVKKKKRKKENGRLYTLCIKMSNISLINNSEKI